MSQTPDTPAPDTEHPSRAALLSGPSNKGPDTKTRALGPQNSGSLPLPRGTHSSAESDIHTPPTESRNKESTPIPIDSSRLKEPEKNFIASIARAGSPGTPSSPASPIESTSKNTAPGTEVPRPTSGASESTAPRISNWGAPFKFTGFLGGSASKIPESIQLVQLVQAASKEDSAQFKRLMEKSITFTSGDIDKWQLALKTAAENSKEEVVELLLSIKGKVTPNNEDPNIIDKKTPGATDERTPDAANKKALDDADGKTPDDADKKTPDVDVNVVPDAINNKMLDANDASDRLGDRLRDAISAVLDGFANSEPPMVDAMQLLLKGITNVEILPEEKGRNFLQLAAGRGYASTVNVLLEGFDPNEPLSGFEGRTALQAAAGEGHSRVVELLLNKGAYVNAGPAEDGGRTALQAAAEIGNKAIVELLLRHGADIDAKPAKVRGKSALEAAAEHRIRLDSLRNSIICGLPTNQPTGSLKGPKLTPTQHLHKMCRRDPDDKPVSEDFLKLIDGDGSEAIINSRDDGGQTPLHLVTARPFEDAVERLLERGARTDLTDLDDRNPLESTIYELLNVRRPVKGLSEPASAAEIENKAERLLEIVLLLLEHGATPHTHTTDRSLDWRKIFPCESGKGDEVLELNETTLDHTADKWDSYPYFRWWES